MDDTQNTLEQLGTALYLHYKMAEDAEKAAEAVQYLQDEGVFDKQEKTEG